MQPKKEPYRDPPSDKPVIGDPVDVWDMVNKYGTYNVQDTSAADHLFPMIGQKDYPDRKKKK